MQEFKKGDIIANDYEIVKLLSEGSFGKVYLGRSVSNNIDVAIKVEKMEVAYFNSLSREVQILEILKDVTQVPQLFWSGQHQSYNIMVLNMLGKDLHYYYTKLKHFSYDCICNIMKQMLDVLEQIHIKNVIHRDLKPENILGSEGSELLYLIDFGIAKNMESKKKQKEKLSFIGTTRYASLAAHLGIEQSKRDDLESLGYIIIYFLTKSLPWMNIEKNESDRTEKIGQMKQEIPIEQLCHGLPKSIMKYMKYIKSLGARSKPNYAQLKTLFKIEIPSIIFDWNRIHKSHKNIESNKSLKSIKNSQHVQSPIKQHKKLNSSSFNLIKEYSLNGSSKLIQQQSSSNNNDKQDSVHVDYTLSYEPSKISKFGMFKKEKSTKSIFGQQHMSKKRISFADKDSDTLTIQSKQYLDESENLDLELKCNLLHYTSVFYNFKNPIEDFKVIYLDIN